MISTKAEIDPQNADSIEKFSILPLPAFGYTPETKSYVGAVLLSTLNFYKDPQTRTSNAKVEFNYTWNNQIILESEWTYFFKKEKWLTKGQVHLSQYPDYYYGIGANSRVDEQSRFQSERFIADIEIFKGIGNQYFAGIGGRVLSYQDIKIIEGQTNHDELQNSRIQGIKFILLNDRRDNLLNTKKGSLMEISNSLNYQNFFYNKLIIDLRKFWVIASSNNVLAVRSMNIINLGAPPFYDLALLGGDEIARGYFLGRYRDQNLNTIQGELRSKIYKRWGLAFLGGLSTIYSRSGDFAGENVKPNAGVGLRFLIDRKENINLRLDYAIGEKGSSGFYIAFGEAF